MEWRPARGSGRPEIGLQAPEQLQARRIVRGPLQQLVQLELELGADVVPVQLGGRPGWRPRRRLGRRLAELAASVIEFKANHVTRRTPSATVEGVRIARRANALSIEKARRELGYAPRPVEPVLRETIARMMGVPVGEVLKHA